MGSDLPAREGPDEARRREGQGAPPDALVRRLQRQLRKSETERRKRERELACLLSIDAALQEIGENRADALQRVADALPSAFRWADRVAARVESGPRSFTTAGYRPSPWRLVRPFGPESERVGEVEVCFVREPPPWNDAPGTDPSPFLAEEERLLDAVAARLGTAVELPGTESPVHRSERFHRNLVRSSPAALFSAGLDGRVLSWNRDAERTFGRPAAEVIGRPLPVVPQDGESPLAEILRRVRAGETVTEVRSVPARPGGPAVVVRIRLAPVEDDDGAVTAVAGTATEVGELKELEAHLRRSQKMEALGRLAAGVAHDFNNLLTVIGSRAEMLLDDLHPDSPPWDEAVHIQKEIRRASRLTRQLLAFGRRQATELALLDLGDTMMELEPLLRRLVPSRVEVTFRLEAGPTPILADRTQLDQVLLNLTANAADAITHEGRITFAVDRCGLTPLELQKLDWPMEPGDYARVTVTDTGQGMDPDVLERIFEPFFTTKAEGEGTGLGLSTVFGIVRQSGGCVLVDSDPARGTTFQVLWPLAPEAARSTGEEGTGEGDPPPNEAAAKVTGSPSGRAPGHATVLVVDDTTAVLEVARRALERAGYQALVASDGSEALAIVESGSPTIDVVISDVVMPRMGGARLLDRLGDLKPGLPVVLTSGHSDRELPAHVRERAVAFLEKPFGPRELLRVVREVLEAGVEPDG